MPEYAVRNTETGDVRIVIAARPETALAHVTTPLFAVTKATAQDGIDACMQGRRIEVAGEEPATVSGHEPPPPMLVTVDPCGDSPDTDGVYITIPGTDADSGAPPPRVDGDPAEVPRVDAGDQQEAEGR